MTLSVLDATGYEPGEGSIARGREVAVVFCTDRVLDAVRRHRAGETSGRS
jgi:hypothetical protein